jgi:hypothetical protein
MNARHGAVKTGMPCRRPQAPPGQHVVIGPGDFNETIAALLISPPPIRLCSRFWFEILVAPFVATQDSSGGLMSVICRF